MRLLLLLILLAATAAGAAGLGTLTVHSSRGDPLDAEIDLAGVTVSGGVNGQVASERTYRTAGMEYNPVLDAARVTLHQRSNGRLYLRVITVRGVNDARLPLLVQLATPRGELSAAYDVVLDARLAHSESRFEPRTPGIALEARVAPPAEVAAAPAAVAAGSAVVPAAPPQPIALTAASPAPARRESRPPAGHTRILAVPQARVPPTIDGVIEDVAWKGAAFGDRFWISEQQRWPSERTEVLVMADRVHLYFAFRVYDSQPDRIQALQTRRGSGLGLDDQIGVQLDPYLSYREISTYSVNANGVQDDAIAGGRARQREWRGDWQAAAVRTPYGWSVEMAIPFEILNFEQGATRMAVNFVRYHYRTSEWSRWADITAQALPEEMGTLTGLVLPAFAKTQPWTFMPYAVIGKNIPDKRGIVQERFRTAGIDIRYQPRPNLTGVLSINPDFSQVESAITNVNFNYNEKFTADPRPFFQEGSAYFGASEYFYSNRVPDFDYGAKLFARMAGYQLGALTTRAPDDRTDTVFRLQREFDATHSLSGMVVTTDRPDLRNQLYVLRGEGREASGLTYALDLASTSTDLQAGDGSKLAGALGWKRDHWSAGLTLDRYSVNFRPANALLAQDLPHTAGRVLYASYYRDLGSGPIRELRGDINFHTRDTLDGRLQRRLWHTAASVELREQVRMGVAYTDGPYRPRAGAPGTWSPTMNEDYYWTGAVDFNTRSSRVGYGGAHSSGFLGGGEYDYTTAYLWTRPTPTTFVNGSAERLSNFGELTQYVVSAGWDITSRMSLLGRYVTTDFSDAYRLAYSLNVAKNMDVFLVYDRDRLQPVKLSAKILMTLH